MRTELFFLVSNVNTNDSTARGVGLVSYYCYHRYRASAV